MLTIQIQRSLLIRHVHDTTVVHELDAVHLFSRLVTAASDIQVFLTLGEDVLPHFPALLRLQIIVQEYVASAVMIVEEYSDKSVSEKRMIDNQHRGSKTYLSRSSFLQCDESPGT